MKLSKIAVRFRSDEDGTVTVDWVVLTAAVVGLGVAVLASVTSGSETIIDDVPGDGSATSATQAF